MTFVFSLVGVNETRIHDPLIFHILSSPRRHQNCLHLNGINTLWNEDRISIGRHGTRRGRQSEWDETCQKGASKNDSKKLIDLAGDIAQLKM